MYADFDLLNRQRSLKERIKKERMHGRKKERDK